MHKLKCRVAIASCTDLYIIRIVYEIKGICEGLRYLQQKSIIHMDLKPENILLDDTMAPKITDFGISRRFRENQNKIITENIVGSPYAI